MAGQQKKNKTLQFISIFYESAHHRILPFGNFQMLSRMFQTVSGSVNLTACQIFAAAFCEFFFPSLHICCLTVLLPSFREIGLNAFCKSFTVNTYLMFGFRFFFFVRSSLFAFLPMQYCLYDFTQNTWNFIEVLLHHYYQQMVAIDLDLCETRYCNCITLQKKKNEWKKDAEKKDMKWIKDHRIGHFGLSNYTYSAWNGFASHSVEADILQFPVRWWCNSIRTKEVFVPLSPQMILLPLPVPVPPPLLVMTEKVTLKRISNGNRVHCIIH